MPNLKSIAQRALQSDVATKLRSWAGDSASASASKPKAAAGHELVGATLSAEVVVYFGDLPSKKYQLQQWIPILERLHQNHTVLLVFRRLATMRAFQKITRIPMVFVRRFSDLMEMYSVNKYKLALYVNNGVSNFQSFNSSETVHVHVNHGESDKISMVANQVKAYDKVFVAGPAAIERHKKVLYDFDMNHLEVVGRPQLDIDFLPELTPMEGMPTIMYAPTWSGENEANNYTSVDVYGEAIIEALLSLDVARIIYKPHPRVADADDPLVRGAHERIVAALKADKATRWNPHETLMKGNILAMFGAVDALITDVSSVGLDFLYAHPEKPLVLTDRRSDPEALREDAPVSAGCSVIDSTNIGTVVNVLREAIKDDSWAEARTEARKYYFGDIARGESTKLFMDAIDRLIADRDAAIAARTAEYGKEQPSVVGE